MMENTETMLGNTKIGKPTLYFATAVMVFMTIYSLGQRIDIFTTAFAMVNDWSHLLYWYAIMVVSGGALVIWLLVISRKSLLRSDLILLAAFLVWMMVSVVMNRDLEFTDNIKVTVSIGVTVLSGYMLGRTFGREAMNFVLKRMILWGSVIWNTGCVISLSMYLVNYHGYYKFGGFVRRSRQGIMEGRLFGCFSDPNYAAVISLLLIVGLYYVYKIMVPASVKSRFAKVTRVYILFSWILYIIYIVLSGSRSCQVAGVAAALVLTVLITYRKRNHHTVCEDMEGTNRAEPSAVFRLVEKAAPTEGSFIRAYGVRILLVIVTAFVLFFGTVFLIKGIGAIVSPGRDTETELEREDVNLENISNNRFDIWREYITITMDRPLWGFSTNGALPYIREKDPEAYIAKYAYNPHNMFVQELVHTGVIGLLILLVFLGRAIVRTWKRSISIKPLPKLFLLGMTWAMIQGVFCFFNVGFFVSPRFEDVIAWIGLGLLEQGCYYVSKKQ